MAGILEGMSRQLTSCRKIGGRGSRVIGVPNFNNSEILLYKMEVHLLAPSTLIVPCVCCVAAKAEFQTRIWYDDRKDESILEMLCPTCLSTELQLEWGIPASTNTCSGRGGAITGTKWRSPEASNRGPVSGIVWMKARQLWNDQIRNHPRPRRLPVASRSRSESEFGTKAAQGEQGYQEIAADAISWRSTSPNGPSGSQIAVMTGDPNNPGLFSVRLKLPPGYKTMPHWHPQTQFITVLSGTLRYGVGDKWDPAAMREVPAGGFLEMQGRTSHYAAVESETILQVSGNGPNERIFVFPR